MIYNFFVLFFTLVSFLYASDIVINVDPNPVVFDDKIRISLVSGMELSSSTLVVGDVTYPMQQLSTEFFKINIVADVKLNESNPYIECVDIYGDKFQLPVDVRIVQSLVKTNSSPLLDSRKPSSIELDTSKLEVDRLQDKVDVLDQKNLSLQDQIKELESKIKNQDELNLSKKELEQQQKALENLQAMLEKEKLEKQKLVQDLKIKMQDYNAKQQDLIKKESILSQIESDLEKKSEDLTASQLEIEGKKLVLEEKTQLLNQQADMINKQTRDLDLKLKQVEGDRLLAEKQRSMVEKDRNLLEQDRNTLEKDRFMVEKDRSMVEKDRDSLKKVRNVLEKDRNMLEKDRFKVEKDRNKLEQDRSIVKKERFELKQDRFAVEQDRSMVNKEWSAVKKDRSAVEKERSTVVKLKQEISKKQELLDLSSKQLQKKKKLLGDEEKRLKDRESKLTNRRMSIQKMSEKISLQRQNLNNLNVSLEKKRDELTKEKEKFYDNQKEKQAVIAKQQVYIQSLEQDMLSGVDQLSELESKYLGLSETLQDERQVLALEKEKYIAKSNELKKDQMAYDELEKELAVRIEILKKLGAYIDVRLDQLSSRYDQSQQSQRDYEQDMQNKVDHIDNLAKLIEKRAIKMESMNKRLAKKNKSLTKRLRHAYKPDYRYTVTPYLGTIVYDDSSNNYNSKEYGCLFKGTVASQFNVGVGVGFRNYFKSVGDNSSQYFNETNYKSFVEYLINPLEKVSFGLRLMLEGDYFNLSNNIYSSLGGYLKYKRQNSNNFGAYVGFDIANGVLFSFGIEKYIVPFVDTVVGDANNAIDLTIAEESFNDLDDDMADFYFKLNPVEEQSYFFPRQIPLVDATKGWYQISAQDSVKYGFFKPELNDGKFYFKPQSQLSYLEASYAVVWAKYLDSILTPEQLDITFSMTAYSEQSYKVNLSLQTVTGEHLLYIKEKAVYYPGIHKETWLPLYNGKVLPAGEYKIVAEVFSDNMISEGNSYSMLEELVHRSETIYKVNEITSLKEKKSVASVIAFKKDYPYLREMVDLKFLDQSVKGAIQISNTPITRLNFIVAISKLLVSLGVEIPKVSIDYSPYRDWDLVPKKYRGYLATYVTTFGYGGDDQSLLNPNKNITKAEASVILQRFLIWKEHLIQRVSINSPVNKSTNTDIVYNTMTL